MLFETKALPTPLALGSVASSLLLYGFGAALLFSNAIAATNSSWTSQLGGRWHDKQNWDGAVPNAPGDRAELLSEGRPVEISLDAPVALGHLTAPGSPSTTLVGSGPLLFDNPGVEVARIEIGATSNVHSFSVPLAIADDEQLIVDLPEPATLNLLGSISTTAGDFVVQGAGTLALEAASPAWNGMFTINGSTVEIRDADSLGTSIGDTRINAGGTLRLIEDVVIDGELLKLDGGTLVGDAAFSGGRRAVLNNRIELLSEGRFENDDTSDSMTLNGSIEGPGDLIYGRGFFQVYGDNSYEGLTEIGSGSVDLHHERGLGSSAAGTVVNEFGTLVLHQGTDEPILLRGGIVRVAATAATTGEFTLERGALRLPRDSVFSSPIVLANDGGDPNIQGDRTTIDGGIGGVGNLLLRGTLTIDHKPLTHDGGLIVDAGNSSNKLSLNTANSYTGPTAVRSGRLAVNNEDALGTSTAPVEVHPAARLVLNTAVTNTLHVAGILDIDAPGLSFNQAILLRPNFSTTSPDGGILGEGTFNGGIHISDEFFADAFIEGGTYNGAISGVGRRVRLGGDHPVVLNGENSYLGITIVRGDTSVDVNTGSALGRTEQGTVVSAGQLKLNVPTNEPIVLTDRGVVHLSVPQLRLPRIFTSGNSNPSRIHRASIDSSAVYDEFVDVAGGILEINADTTIRGLQIREHGTVRVSSGNALHINANELVTQSGSIDGRIIGPSILRKITADRTQLSTLPGFNGEIFLEQGILEVLSDASFGTSGGEIRITGQRNAQLLLDGPMILLDKVNLENATGVNYGGAVVTRGGGRVELYGTVELGSTGSLLTRLDIRGPIRGGALTTVDPNTILRIFNGHNTYTGMTTIRDGTLVLGEQGRLTDTNAIAIFDDPDHLKGTLRLDNSVSRVDDRIADDIPVVLKGGGIQVLGPTNERLATLSFSAGDSEIDLNWGPEDLNVSRRLIIESLTRNPGATGRVVVTSEAQLDVTNLPDPVGGIFPWLLVEDRTSTRDRITGFGARVDGQLAPLTDYHTNIQEAGFEDNVLIRTQGAGIFSDRTINSLTFGLGSNTLGLSGRVLQLRSGGLRINNGTEILNGKLTAGDGKVFELVISDGRGGIDADIIDNGANPVDVTVSASNVRFSGDNAYTGKTYVNDGVLSIEAESALPENSDIDIVGGEFRIDYVATAPKTLGTVRIAGDGALLQRGSGFGGQGVFAFDQILLEDGELEPGQLVGEGQIIKTTFGVAELTADSRSTYSGDVIVDEGRLTVRGLPQASFSVRGGELYLRGGGNAVNLAGGTLSVTNELSSEILVSKDSRISTFENAELSGALIGAEQITLGSEVRYNDDVYTLTLSNDSPAFSGDVIVDSVHVEVDTEMAAGTGKITVLPAGRMRFGGRSIDSRLPSFDFANDVFLQGGALIGSDIEHQPRRLIGDLYVSQHSEVGAMHVLGTTYLEEGSRLIAARGSLRFFGDIQVGPYAELEYGLQIGPSNSADVASSALQILGTIASNADNSVLNLIDRGLDEILLDASVHVAANQTLQVTQDGAPIVLKLSGPDKAVFGNGTLLNQVEVRNGGAVSPGHSSGALLLGGSATFSEGATYTWEISDAIGVPGQSMGWDLLQVDGDLVFEATAAEPFVVRMFGVDQLGENGATQHFDPKRNYRWLIASASSITGFDKAAVQVDSSAFLSSNVMFPQSRLFLEVDGGDLFLIHRVPEPPSWATLGLTLAVIAVRRKWTFDTPSA